MFKRITRSLPLMFTSALLVAVGFLLALVAVPQLNGTVANAIDEETQPIEITSGAGLLLEQERIFAELYNDVAPSVVAITVYADAGQGIFVPASTGSGFMIDMQGHIVTNYHVVDGADRVEVRMYDGTITEARIIGEDPNSDIAVIRVTVPQERLRPMSFADSSQLTIGQTVIAMGNPFQNDWTLTQGIISALNRSIPSLNDRFSIGGVIQTDAAINPGNSGGPLVDLEGRVIGVNSQIESETRANSGVGFAAPSNLVAKVVRELIENGEIEYSYIGIGSNPITLDIIDAYDLPNNIQGVPVAGVEEGSPADVGGLLPPTDTNLDIITAIDGTPVRDFDDMIGYLGINTDPGDTVTFTVYRNGEVLDITVTLTNRP